MADSRVASILWVGDDSTRLRTLEAALQPLGPCLIGTSSSEEALERLIQQPFAVILLDASSSSVDGFETAQLLRQRARRPLPPLLFIGDGGPAQARRAHAAGAVDFIAEPFDEDILRAKVSVFVELHTAHRDTEERLRFLESLQRHVHDSIIVTDLSGRIVHWSRGATTLFGYSAEESLGQSPQHLYPDQDPSSLARDLPRILEGQDYVGEWRGRRKDGTEFWVDITTTLMRDARGQPVGFIGVGKDVTARRNAEQKLRFLSEASRLLMDGPEDVEALLQRVSQLAVGSIADICVVDLLQEDGTLRRVSLAHRVPEREPLLRESLRFTSRLDAPSPLLRALDSGKGGLFEPPQAARSAEHLRLIEALEIQSVMAVPLHGRSRRLGVMVLSTCKPGRRLDQDDLEMAEELARRVAGTLDTHHLFREAQESLVRAEKEKRTAEILSRLGLAFASELDRDKLVQRVTDEATELTGAAFGAFFHNFANDKGESYLLYTLSGVPREAFAKFPMPRNTRIFKPTFDGTRTMRLDDVTRSPDYGHNPPHRGMPEGHLPVRSYLAVPVRSRSGEVLGGLFFGHPEPGRFRPEHEHLVEGLAAQAAVALDNALLYRRAQLAVSLRDEFLQVAAHELRTPTTSLKLQVQSLLRGVSGRGSEPLLAKHRERLEKVDGIVGKLAALINELLDISRITAGNLHLTWEEVDLCSVAREVALRFEAQAAQVQSLLHISAERPILGRWDRLRLEQVITNLLSNALKYGAGGQVYLDVSMVGELGAAHGAGRGDRHRARGAAASLRSLRARGVRAPLWRAGAGALHHPADRPGAGRHRLRGEHPGPGRDVHRRAAPEVLVARGRAPGVTCTKAAHLSPTSPR